MLEPLLAWSLAAVCGLAAVVMGILIVRQKRSSTRERLRTSRILETNTDAVISLDRRWRIVDVSAGAAKSFAQVGKTPSNMEDRPYFDEFPHQKGTPVETEFKRAMAERRTVAFEFHDLVHQRWLDIHAYPDTERLNVYFRDTTGRRSAAEQTEKASRELNDVKAALDQHAIVAITDSRGKITYVNEKFCAISKYSREELIGQDHRIINSGFHSKDFIRGIWHTITAGRVWKGEIKNRAKDGSFYWVDTTIVPYLGENGKPNQYIAIRADITERKKAEEQTDRIVRELNDVKSALDEHAIVAITDRSGKITYVNDKFCAISKYSRAELIGQDHRIINSGFHPKGFIRSIWQTIGSGSVWKGEIKNKAKDGTFYWVDTTIVPYLGENGKPVQYIAIRADITERKLAEERTGAALHELNDVKAALDEHAIVAITDRAGKITYVNDKFCAISKFTRDELLGQDHRIINSGYHTKEFIRSIWASIGHGRVWKGEIQNRAKDGSIYWVDTTIVPYIGESGKPAQYIAIRADITERKKAEDQTGRALRELNEVKAALDEHAIVAITDPRGKITYVNDKFCAISKYSRAELIGKDHRIINSGYHPKEFIRSLWETIASGRVWKGEIRNRAKDGSIYWVETTLVPYLGEDGKPVQFIAIRADITERKRAEEQTGKALRELNDVRSAIDEHAIVAITDPRGKITYVNDKFCAISKYSREELLGQDHRIINSGYHPKSFIRQIWTTIGSGWVWKGEIKNQAKDGTFYWVDTTITPYLGDDGKPLQYIAIRADITERKTAEEELHKAQHKLQGHAATLEYTVTQRTAELREKIGELEAFSYSVSHDMRQPLRSMQGYARILMTECAGKLDPENVRYLERIRVSANRLDRLIQDVLTYSRATRAEGALAPINLAQTVREIVETYPRLRDVEIEIAVPDCTVMAYEVALTQCVSNLLGNGVKFMPPGRTPKLRVWSELNGKFIRLWVQDNGIGIAPADHQRIFDIFSRVHSDEVYEGTGIGLSIVRKAIEKMGGKVGLESELNKGSLFWIDLHASESPDVLAPAPTQLAMSHALTNGSRPGRGLLMNDTILLVEDSADDVFFMQRAMKGAGVRAGVQVAIDGQAAVDYLSGSNHYADRQKYPQPSLVLLDLKLPHVPGLEVLKWIRSQPEHQTLPVIVLTSSGERSDLKRAYRLGANSFMVKPSPDDLDALARCVGDYWFRFSLIARNR